MKRLLPLALLGLCAFQAGAGQTSERAEPWRQLPLAKLEQRLAEIDSQLALVARLNMRGGVGPVGFRSAPHEDGAHTEWIQIELGGEESIDRVVLVPTIWRDSATGFRADGFPVELRLVVGTNADLDGTTVASYGAADRLLPRLAPLVVDFPAITASWVRLEATALSPRVWDGRYILQLAEILVFSGQENIALRMPVQVSSGGERKLRHKQLLVDGFGPYLMDAQAGQKSLAYVSPVGIGPQPELTIDLGETQALDRIHLHVTELSDSVPQTLPDGFGVPRRLVVDGANEPDFSDAVRLTEYRWETVYDVGPIIMRRFPTTPCRYVRLIAVEPFLDTDGDASSTRIGFAEIELFSAGQNVAIGKPFRANFALQRDSIRSISALTDGHNFYGKILPLRSWLNELARRHELETERPLVAEELNRRYARQAANLNRMTWLAGLLAVGIGITFLIDRIVRMRQVAQIRNRLAADLHDELGANLHVIGLLGDLAQEAVDSPDKLKSIHQRIRVMTERSGDAVQYCTNMLNAEGLYENLLADMQRTTDRVMADQQGELTFQGDEDILRGLKPRTRADLFLFYKECLVNISRHSGATQFSAELSATPKKLCLTVTDNGQGLTDPSGNGVPHSLRRRARLLGGQVATEHPHTGGTRITLNLRTRSWGRRK